MSEPDSRLTLAVVITAHNRRDVTLSCLRNVFAQDDLRLKIQVYLCDDGSTDGTAEAIRSELPHVRVIHGSGELYWAGGMRKAMSVAMADDPDYYLWLNDDTYLDDGSIGLLVNTHQELTERGREDSIVVGTTTDPVSGEVTYGGVSRRSRFHPFLERVVDPSDVPKAVDTMYGNCVLLPRSVVRKAGNLDEAFVHRMADCDYGYRAREAGCGIFVAPGTVGVCARNEPAKATGRLSRDPESVWAELLGPKALPTHAWVVYARRYGGPVWPVFWAYPYARASLRWSAARASRWLCAKQT